MNGFGDWFKDKKVESRPQRSTCENCQSDDSTPQSTDIEFEPHCKYIRADSMRPLAPKFIPATTPVPGGDPIRTTSNGRNRWLLDKDTSGIANPPRAHDGGVVTIKVKGNANTAGYTWELGDKAEFVKVDADGKVTGQYLDKVPGSPTKYTGKGTMHVRALGAPGTVTVKAEKNGKTGTTKVEIVKITFEKCHQGASCPQTANFPLYGFDDCDPQPPITRPPINWNIKDSTTAPASIPKSAYEYLLYPHISVESDMPTHVHVKIEGNVAAATDFTYKSDATGTCEILNASSPLVLPDTQSGPRRAPVMDVILQLKAGEVQQKKETLLRVMCHGINNNDQNHTCKENDLAKLGVHVYKRKEVTIIVVKVFDSSKPESFFKVCENTSFNSEDRNNTRLRQKLEKMNEAVVTYKMEDYDTPPAGFIFKAPSLIDVKGHAQASEFFDADGYLIFYHGMVDGGPDGGFLKIKNALNLIPSGTTQYAIVVSKMKAIYVLKETANAGASQIKITATYAGENFKLKFPHRTQVFEPDGNTPVLSGGNPVFETTYEEITTRSVSKSDSGATVTLERPLSHQYQAGTRIEIGAAGLGSSPVLATEKGVLSTTTKMKISSTIKRGVEKKESTSVTTIETDETLDGVFSTVMHEVGHTNLALFDINDVNDVEGVNEGIVAAGKKPTAADAEALMHHKMKPKDNILRYCPRPRRYDPDFDPVNAKDVFKQVENQWEMIPR